MSDWLCDFVVDGQTAKCQRCGREISAALTPIKANCRTWNGSVAAGGPGTELRAIFATLDIHEKADCPCKEIAALMDLRGIDWCRANRDYIVGRLNETSKLYARREKWHAARKAIETGLAFKINWADPFPGLVELAIERAEQK